MRTSSPRREPSTTRAEEPPALEAVSAQAAPASDSRFIWVDAIRGLACVAVIMRHLFLSGALHPSLTQLFPAWLGWLHVVGAAGVYAFFVISGFVIAHSLRHNPLSAKSCANFILRRQLRLDPVYWCALLLFLVVPRLLLEGSAAPKTSVTEILVNVFYLQNMLHKTLGHGGIIGPAWTLCIEIQFYLVFILILLCGARNRRMVANSNLTSVSLGVLLVTGLLALGLKHVYFRPSLFFSYWHFFILGALTYYAMQNILSRRWYGFFVAAFALSSFFSPVKAINEFGSQHSLSLAAMSVALATALSLFYAGKKGKMSLWGNNFVLRFLGRISYPLYLIHVLVIGMLTQIPPRTPLAALGIYLLCFVISVGCAQVLHWLVEGPSIKLAARWKPVPNQPQDRATLSA